MRSKPLTLAAGAIAIAAATLTAQQASGPITPHAYPLDDAHYVHYPLPPGEQAYGRIDGSHLKQYVVDITSVSLKSRDEGNRYWGRIAGTKYDDMVEGWAEQKFKAAGLENVRRQYFDLPPQWFPTAWGITATGGGKTLTLKTAQPTYQSMATPAGGLQADAVWVGLGTGADFADRDVKGKAVVLYSVPTPSVINNSAVWMEGLKRAEEHGAAAVVIILAIPGTNFTAEMWAKADKIPTFSVGMEDGLAIRDLIEGGGARFDLSLNVEMKSGLRDANVWGELPGTTDEDIIVMAHHDAFFTGALDNASGMATMIGLAEYFAKIPKSQRRRTIKFVTTSGHHAGSLGVKWMHDNKTAFLAKTALMLNCEHVSVTQTYFWGNALRTSNAMDARRWWVYGSDKLAAAALGAYQTFGVAVYHDMEPNASGDMGQASLDAPSVQMIESPLFYHTDHDTPDVVPSAGLEAVARAYAKLIDQANRLDLRDLLPRAAGAPTPNR